MDEMDQVLLAFTMLLKKWGPLNIEDEDFLDFKGGGIQKSYDVSSKKTTFSYVSPDEVEHAQAGQAPAAASDFPDPKGELVQGEFGSQN